jgi:hypothetical protein
MLRYFYNLYKMRILKLEPRNLKELLSAYYEYNGGAT